MPEKNADCSILASILEFSSLGQLRGTVRLRLREKDANNIPWRRLSHIHLRGSKENSDPYPETALHWFVWVVRALPSATQGHQGLIRILFSTNITNCKARQSRAICGTMYCCTLLMQEALFNELRPPRM